MDSEAQVVDHGDDFSDLIRIDECRLADSFRQLHLFRCARIWHGRDTEWHRRDTEWHRRDVAILNGIVLHGGFKPYGTTF